MLIQYTLFKKRPKVGGYQLHPLSAGRLLILEELGNPLGTGEVQDEVDQMSVYEAFMVASMDADELADAVADEAAWKRQVRVFSLDLADDDLNKFWEIMQDELSEAAKKMTEPAAPKARKAGKKHSSRRKK